jgi:1,4-alpha-glucan branching enzyme
MRKGFLCIVLHAHLPYVRHPEYDCFLEENWLYEAITETYIPLLDMFGRLINDRISFGITLSLSPTLVEMFNDHFLRERYKRYIENLLELTEREIRRTRGDIHFEPVARMYHERFRRVRFLFEEVYQKDLTAAFQKLQDAGNIRIITTAATHAFLPNLFMYPEAVRAQIRIAAEHYKRNFCRCLEGIWLPECGYAPGFENYLQAEGIRYFFLDTHGILFGRPFPEQGIYAPVFCPNGTVAFGRDPETSRQVWSSTEGYPGDFDYRDFYRDIGYDLDLEYLRPNINPDGIRSFTGIKYWRITGKTDDKKPYVPEIAAQRVREHAMHFIQAIQARMENLSLKSRICPVITAPYDAELFGHWWFEGLYWLEELLRGIQAKAKNFLTGTPAEYLSLFSDTDFQMIQPSQSSWGDLGYSEVWLNRENDYIYRYIHKSTEKMIWLANRFSGPSENQIPLLQSSTRLLNQAAREILLSQQSDWAFIMKAGTSSEYAKKRFEGHIQKFNALYQLLINGEIQEGVLKSIEDTDRIFQELDYRAYSSSFSKGYDLRYPRNSSTT